VELVIAPVDSGDHRLAYTAVVSRGVDVFRAFVDAHSGRELFRYSEIQTQASVGTGQGVFGERKKISVVQEAGTSFADDRLRPPVLRTFDMRANFNRAISVLNGSALSFAERAQDSDNDWTDVSAVDAHVHIGWTYDYFFKRHDRRGLDNRDRPITTLINGLSQQDALTVPPDVFGTFVANAFWCGSCGGGGVMFFGNGFPANLVLVSTGQNVAQLAGALDIAAHELTHGVTDSSSRLIYMNESGALNEAFSDIMGTAVEFFHQTPGSGRGQADYLIGEDVVRGLRTGSVHGIRSMANPRAYGDPDHYSIRFTGPQDNGGVHINSGIANHAFYLAIEGGTNRTSGLAVQGVGGANREQIERVFYRAFVFLLPSNATFATARAATIQAARDLYGVGSAADRAVTQAWTAVGVH
jgi:thermolysin